jgi:hypothetical protein
MRIVAAFLLLVIGITLLCLYLLRPQAQPVPDNTKPAATTASVPSASPVLRGTVAPLSVKLTSDTADSSGPGETQSGKLYADNGQEIMYIRETGQLVTASGELLHTVSDNAMARYDEVTQELLDSANRAMKIWFDSVAMQHKLQSGSGQTLTHIKATDMLYISTILDRNDGLTKTIYVTRQKYTTDWWDRIVGTQDAYYYKYYDMNGRHIPDDWFTEHTRAPWWKSALRVLNGTIGIGNPGWWYGLFKGYEPLNAVSVTEAGTFQEVTDLLEFATWHPWDKLENVLTANNDGVYNSGVYINPANGQLCDRLGAPIYHIETGLPFVYKDNKILTIPDRKEQSVTDGILQNGATRQYLRKLGFEEYVHYIDDPEFGIVGVLVLAVKDGDGKLIKWTLPNGDDAEGIVRDDVGTDTDGEKLTWDSFWSKFSGLFDGWGGLGGIAGIILTVLIIILCLPILPPVLQVLFMVISAPFKWMAKLFHKRKREKKHPEVKEDKR